MRNEWKKRLRFALCAALWVLLLTVFCVYAR